MASEAAPTALLVSDLSERRPANAPKDVIYISYDGMTDPLGRSQVLPYLVGLAKLGHGFRLVSMEKLQRLRSGRDAVERICADAGIEWHPLTYRSRPPIVSAMINVAALKRKVEQLHRARPADLTHCRSDLAGIAGLALKRRHDVPLLYDMRAFWPDERVDGGTWDQGKLLYRAIFRYFKARQRELLAEADEIVMLADEGRKALGEIGPIPNAPVTVIPCCSDFDHFRLVSAETRTMQRAAHGIPANARVLLYLGSVGTWYMLDEMLDFFAAYRKRHSNALMLFVTPDAPDAIYNAARTRGVKDAIQVHSATREDVPGWLAVADLGLFFIQPVFSKKASSPTKLGEMLAAGLPVVTNAGVGDVAAVVRDLGAGAVVPSFDAEGYGHAIDELSRLDVDPRRLSEQARAHFDVRHGIDKYDSIYRRLAASVKRSHSAAGAVGE